jgi:hypothetical protein
MIFPRARSRRTTGGVKGWTGLNFRSPFVAVFRCSTGVGGHVEGRRKAVTWGQESKENEMKQKTKKTQLYRQGDVLFTRIDRLPAGERKKRANATVAYGEVTGHSHALAVEDRKVAEVLEIGDGLYVHVTGAGVRIEGGATFVHEEHGSITLEPGAYRVTIQREYLPEGIQNVAD